MPKKKRPVGRPKSYPNGWERMYTKIDPATKDIFSAYCRKMGLTMSHIIAKLVEKFLKNRGEIK